LPSHLLFKNVKSSVYKTIILPVVSYGCETWSRILREDHRLRVFENRVLRRIFRPERGEVTGEWRKMHEELHILFFSPNIIRTIKSKRIICVGHVVHMGRKSNAYKILVGKPEGKMPLGRLRHKREDNMKMNLRKIGLEGVDWFYPTRNREQWQAPVNMVMNILVP
jgi:hypothetical protein